MGGRTGCLPFGVGPLVVHPGSVKRGVNERERLLAAGAADDNGLQVGAAAVLEDDRRLVGEVSIAPVHEHQQHRPQLAPGRGWPVFRARRPLAEDLLQHAGLDQVAQPGGQHVAGSADVAGDGVEAADAVEDLPEDQQEYFSPITPRVSAIEQGRAIVVMPPV